jgi:hypothetical protein
MKQLLFGALALLGLTLSGCAEKYTIRPSQLSVLNDETRLAVFGSGTTSDIGIQKVLRLETTSGEIVEINPPVVVTITTSDGRELQFCSPLRADFDGGVLKINHACGPPARLERTEIEKVEVQEW